MKDEVTHFMNGNYISANRYFKQSILDHPDKLWINFKFMPIYNFPILNSLFHEFQLQLKQTKNTVPER